MPTRLIDIFDTSKTDAQERQKKIACCDYHGQSLDDAESFAICLESKHVDSGEQLARAMERPSHVVPNALEYTSGAFQEASKRGLSVQQLSLTTPEEIHKFGNAKAHSKGRDYLGYVTGLCGFLREARSPVSDKRMFGIFSTPELETPSHVDIFIVISPTREEKEAIKYFFYDAFNLERIVKP